jgi:hypothetical protein
MTEHIENNKLEKLFICPDELSAEEKNIISGHLEKCALCRMHAASLKEFYSNLQSNLDSPPTERDEVIAEELLARKRLALPEKRLALQERMDNALSTFIEIIEPYRRPLAQRVVHYIKIHPLRVATGFSLAAALVFATLLIRPMFKDTNPSYARAKDEFLVVYNKNGEELWRKHIGLDYDHVKLETVGEKGFEDDYLATYDVDGDGKREVIATFGMIGEYKPKNAVFCFNANGEERWRYLFNRSMVFGNEKFTDEYSIQRIMVGDFAGDGKVKVTAIAFHGIYYPTSIIGLNAADGTAYGEYWTPGNIMSVTHRDIDHDGIEELFFCGQNNGYDAASLTVLDPRYISGHSPAPVAYTPKNIPNGTEIFCLLFPRSDLKHVLSFKRNIVFNLQFKEDSTLTAWVKEKVPTANSNTFTNTALIYHFDNSMRCTGVDADDWFVQFHKKMEAEGKITKHLDARYYEDLRKSVLYWNGQKLVNTSTKNSLYTKSANLP